MIRAIPGVESAAVTHEIPLRDRGGNTIWMDGTDPRQGRNVSRSRVGPEYFRTLQIRFVAGRDFDARDRAGSVRVAIVNEAFSRTFMNGANPVGHRFWIEATPGETETPYEIVGLVRNTKYGDLREEFRPIVYDASAQDPVGPGAQFLIRSRLNEADTSAAVRRLLGEVNPAITVSFRGLSPLIEATILRERLMATLARFFGLLALTLACVGLYGVLSFNVASRANEIGIRLALGAGPRSIFWLIQREALILVVAGLLVGLPLIFAATRVASRLLFGLTPTDPMSLLSAALVMLAVAVVSGYLPSRSATRVDPMMALRRE